MELETPRTGASWCKEHTKTGLRTTHAGLQVPLHPPSCPPGAQLRVRPSSSTYARVVSRAAFAPCHPTLALRTDTSSRMTCRLRLHSFLPAVPTPVCTYHVPRPSHGHRCRGRSRNASCGRGEPARCKSDELKARPDSGACTIPHSPVLFPAHFAHLACRAWHTH